MQKARQFLWLSVAILLVGAGLRFYNVAETSVTTDEALTYQRTQGSLQDRLEHIAEPGNHVPLYFLSEELLPHETDLGLRYSSLLLSLVGIALMIRYSASVFRMPRMALIIGLWMAVTPFMVLYARDARPYPMVFVLGLLSSLAFFRLLQNNHHPRDWVVFGFISLLTYFTHYSAAALPISQFILLLFLKVKPKFWVRWFTTQAIISAPIFLWILLLATPKSESVAWIATPNIGRPYYTVTNITIGYEAIPIWYFVVGLIPLTMGLIVGIRTIWRHREQQIFQLYWLILGFAPMLLVFFISQFNSIYFERYFMVTAPAYFIIVGIGWRVLLPSIRLEWLAGIVIVVGLGVTLNELSTTHFEPQDWRSATNVFEANYQEGDGILLDGPHETAFWHHYRGNLEDIVLSSEKLDPLYDGRVALCTLPYQRVWIMTGNRLPRALNTELIADATLQVYNYHQISVHLVQVPTCE